MAYNVMSQAVRKHKFLNRFLWLKNGDGCINIVKWNRAGAVEGL